MSSLNETLTFIPLQFPAFGIDKLLISTKYHRVSNATLKTKILLCVMTRERTLVGVGLECWGFFFYTVLLHWRRILQLPARSYLNLMKTCTVMSYHAPKGQDWESPHTSHMGHREAALNYSPYPETLQNFHSLLRNQDSGTGGDRNESQTQFFSPSFLSLTVPGRCIGRIWHKSKDWVVLPEYWPCLGKWGVTGFRWTCLMFEWANNFYTHDIREKKLQNCQFTIEKPLSCKYVLRFNFFAIMTNFVSATNCIISLISPPFWSFVNMRNSTSSTKTGVKISMATHLFTFAIAFQKFSNWIEIQ